MDLSRVCELLYPVTGGVVGLFLSVRYLRSPKGMRLGSVTYEKLAGVVEMGLVVASQSVPAAMVVGTGTSAATWMPAWTILQHVLWMAGFGLLIRRFARSDDRCFQVILTAAMSGIALQGLAALTARALPVEGIEAIASWWRSFIVEGHGTRALVGGVVGCAAGVTGRRLFTAVRGRAASSAGPNPYSFGPVERASEDKSEGGSAGSSCPREGGVGTPSPNPAERPNVVLFLTDDQRFDTIAALGNEYIVTPTLDRLVAEGTTFTRNYIMGGTSGAVCMPSRAMLHTGRTLFHLDREGQSIPEDHVTLGEHFRRFSYETFGTGKWHNGPASFARSFSCGDRVFFGGMSDHFRVPLNGFDPTGEYPQDGIYLEEGKHSSDLFSESAIEFLRSRDGSKPFFACVSFTAPHDPRDTLPEFHDMYDPDTIPVPENFMPEHPFDNGELRVRDELLAEFPRTEAEIRQHIADYYAMITHVDDRIGKVLNTLEETGELANTILVFAGDNGLALGRHGLMGKQNLYEHSVGVPLILAGPGIPKGEQREAMSCLIDVFPTLCDLIGVDIPETVEGMSLLPVLRDPEARVRDTMLFAYKGIHRGVRDEKWKLIEYVVDGTRHTQLYDLENDPSELDNLVAEPACREHLVRLRREIVQWRDDLDDRSSEFWDCYEVSA